MLKDKLINQLDNDDYWQNSDRGTYIVLYKNKRLNTGQIAYLTIGSAKKSLYEYFRYVHDQHDNYTRSEKNELIKNLIQELIDNGQLTFYDLSKNTM